MSDPTKNEPKPISSNLAESFEPTPVDADAPESVEDDFQSQCVLVSSTLKMMSHPQRLMLLCLLKEGPRTVGELQENLEGISQSHVSQFLNRLRLEGIVEGNRQGTFIYYTIKDPRVVSVLKALNTIYCDGKR